MYAVFDGHGTDVVAQYAATHAPLHLRDAFAAELNDGARTMRRAFDTLDEHIADMCREQVRVDYNQDELVRRTYSEAVRRSCAI